MSLIPEAAAALQPGAARPAQNRLFSLKKTHPKAALAKKSVKKPLIVNLFDCISLSFITAHIKKYISLGTTVPVLLINKGPAPGYPCLLPILVPTSFQGN